MPPDNAEQSAWFVENLQPHEAMLRSWLTSRFPSGIDIDDIIQDACVRVMRAREKGPVNAPKAFFFATARNLALNAIRSSKARREKDTVPIDTCEFLDEASDVHETVARNQELEILTKAIQALPDRCRQIFTLRKVYGMPQREIAKKLGISARTVNAQISIGVNKCAEFVESYCQGGIQ